MPGEDDSSSPSAPKRTATILPAMHDHIPVSLQKVLSKMKLTKSTRDPLLLFLIDSIEKVDGRAGGWSMERFTRK